MRHVTTAVMAAALLILAACGQSESDKAKDQVCDARSDLSKQVNELKGLTLTTATVDGIKANVKAIQDDLTKIKDAQGKLNEDRKSQVLDATNKFESQATAILTSLDGSTSLGQAATQLKSAGQQLTASYQQTFAKIDCG